MTLPESHTRVQSIDLETLLSSAHRAKDLLTGARALLTGTSTPMAPTACNLVLEARAQLDVVVSALESLAAVEAEARRHAHAQAAKLIFAKPGEEDPRARRALIDYIVRRIDRGEQVLREEAEALKAARASRKKR